MGIPKAKIHSLPGAGANDMRGISCKQNSSLRHAACKKMLHAIGTHHLALTALKGFTNPLRHHALKNRYVIGVLQFAGLNNPTPDTLRERKRFHRTVLIEKHKGLIPKLGVI